MNGKYIPNTVEFYRDGSAVIHLTHGRCAMIDACEWPALRETRWCVVKGRYVQGRNSVTGKKILLHRAITSVEPTQKIDHKNGDGFDNRRVNLRVATLAQNQQNRKLNVNNTAGRKGVSYRNDCGKYRARIVVEGKRIPLGNFMTADEAGRAYAEAAVRYYGEFARLI